MKYGIFRICVLFLAALAGCFGQRAYTATPITIPGYDFSGLIWISDDGKTGFGAGLKADPYQVQCLTYKDGVATSIATPGALCQPDAANVGAYLFKVTPSTPANAYQATPTQLFAYKNNQFFALLQPDGTTIYSVPGFSGVNSDGQIATTLFCLSPGATDPTLPGAKAFCAYRVSTSGVFTRLSDLGDFAYATAINASGDIAGSVDPPASHVLPLASFPANSHLVVWNQAGVMKDISALTGRFQLGIPKAINSKGQILGPGFLYDGVSTILPIQVTGAASTNAISMNDSGEVVGTYRPKPDNGINRPFYYSNGTAVDLNALVTDLPKNKFISTVSYINNAGQILVTAVDIAQPVSIIANGTAATQYLLTPTGASLPAPVITGVGNAASFVAGTASSTLIAIQGANLSTTTRQWANSDFVNGKLPTSLDGVSVTINGVAAYTNYISPTQINVLAPDDAATGPVQVQVTNSKGASNSFTTTKSEVMPAFFTVGSKPFDYLYQGGTYIAAQHGDGTLVGPPALGASYTPAKPGEEIQLFGTGFGATVPPSPASQVINGPVPLANQVTVLVDNKPAQVVFAGRTATGLDQINVIVPNVFPDGDVVLQAKLNGVVTQSSVFLAVKF